MTARRELERLAGSMLMVGLRGAGPEETVFRSDLQSCRNANVGGVILFDVDLCERNRLVGCGLSGAAAGLAATRNIHSPAQVRELVHVLRVTLGPDILIGVDQEGGAVARLGPERGFLPTNSAESMALGTPAQHFEAMREQAEQLRKLGFDLNFAPCVDLALEPDNPVITRLGRSFGSAPERVTACAEIVIESHQAAGLISCLKHFPGHGSAVIDTHHALADITSSWARETELVPYRVLIGRRRRGISLAVMTGHLLHRRIDPAHPASLSSIWTEQILRGELGFDGMVVTDSLDMDAISARYEPEESVVLAVDAGADVVLHGFNAPKAPPEHPACSLAEAIIRGAGDGRIRGGVDRLRAAQARRERALAAIARR